MNTFSSRRSLFIAVALMMLVFALQYRPVARMPAATYSRGIAHLPLRSTIQRIARPIAPKSSVHPVQEVMALHLRSNARDYNYIFSGQTLCGGRPCAATLDILLDTSRNPNLRRTIQTTDDGVFWFQVPLTEVHREQVDWKIVAHNSEGQNAEKHGRQILMDDPVVAVEADLNLR